jgi:hypothetical protein
MTRRLRKIGFSSLESPVVEHRDVTPEPSDIDQRVRLEDTATAVDAIDLEHVIQDPCGRAVSRFSPLHPTSEIRMRILKRWWTCSRPRNPLEGEQRSGLVPSSIPG